MCGVGCVCGVEGVCGVGGVCGEEDCVEGCACTRRLCERVCKGVTWVRGLHVCVCVWCVCVCVVCLCVCVCV